MFMGRVLGKVVCTVKDETLTGGRLLVVQAEDQQGRPEGKPLVALDLCHAGEGDRVFLVKSREASIPWPVPNAPLDATIVGLIDQVALG